MPFDSFSSRVAQISNVPTELLDYQLWLKTSRGPATGKDYLFSQEIPRFEPRREDVAVPLPGLSIKDRGRTVRLLCQHPHIDLELEGVTRREAEQILSLMDGERCLAEVLWESGVGAEALGHFLRATFGRVVLAPASVLALEQSLAGTQIVRFPCPPYAIERSYWQNMIDVRQRLFERGDALAERSTFEELLRDLHVLALMGRSLCSFYKPASPAADLRVAPGVFYLSEPRLFSRPTCDVFLEGPRVNVSLVGGEEYHRMLYSAIDDSQAAEDGREHREHGLSWGRVVRARAEKDDRPRSWFLPPRPLLPAHLEVLRESLLRASQASEHDDRKEMTEACAQFHQCFVRLHPFHCANQSIAMNVVNAYLERTFGAGIPHLLLDLLALRLNARGYARVFERALRAWVVIEEDPTRRFTALRERKLRSQLLIERLSASHSAAERESLLAADPEASRWSLLND